MDFAEFERRFLIIQPLIRETGSFVCDRRKIGKPDVNIKSDGSPVTEYDILANKRICSFLMENFPGEVVIGEESEQMKYRPGSGYVWYVDPIDGTKAYIDGRDGYFVLIGLCVKGIPVFGMVYQPEKDLLIYGWTGKASAARTGNSGEYILKVRKPSWNDLQPIVMKSIHSDHRRFFESRFGVTRAPFQTDMIDMLSTLYGYSNGYVSYRPTAYWDLCAPAALLRSSGYRLSGDDVEHPVLFNDGTVSTSFYYCLPYDTPEAFISEVKKRQLNHSGH